MTLQEPVPKANDEVVSSVATVVDDIETNTKDGVPFANARPLTDSLDFNLTVAPKPVVAQYEEPSQPSTAMASSASASEDAEEAQRQQEWEKKKRQKILIMVIGGFIALGVMIWAIVTKEEGDGCEQCQFYGKYYDCVNYC